MNKEVFSKLHVLFPLLSREQVESRIVEMADASAKSNQDDKPVYIRVKNGANYFADQLEKRFDEKGFEYETGSIAVHSMKGDQQGEFELTQEYQGPDLKGRKIVIVEDIVDSGHTVEWLLSHFEAFAPASIGIIALFAKPDDRIVDVELTDVGFNVWGFVVGSNLDYDQKYRELGGLYVVKFLTQLFTNPWLFFNNRKPEKFNSS